MRAHLRAAGQFLDHPILSRVSNAAWLLSLAPFVAALVSAVVGRVLDQPTLFLVAVGLATLGIVLAAITAMRQRQALARHPRESSTPSQEWAPLLDVESQRTATFVAVEAEVALASEEAMEMAKMLRAEWPHISPDGALVEAGLPDWRDKTTDFIAAVLGSANRAAFRAAGTGTDTLECLESEGRFLVDLAQKLTLDVVRANEAEVLKARRKRRGHEAARFLEYSDHRSPGAPPKSLNVPVEAEQNGQQSSSAPVEIEREFSRRDDRIDLAQRCHMLAGSIERWVKGYEREQTETVEKWVEECLAADADLDPAETRRKAYNRYDKTWEFKYAIKYSTEAKELFSQAYEMHEIAKGYEQLAVRPLATEFARAPKLFGEIADSLLGTDLSSAR